MDDQHLFDELLRVTRNLGVPVRVEPFETPATAGGGSCVLRGDRMILIDARAPIRERIGALARALSERQTETVFMLPEVREAVETMRELRLGGNTSQSIALDGGCAMPRYEFLCEKCKKPFELIMTMSEREKAKPRCPTCKGTKVTPQLGGFMAQTAKKS